MIFKEKDVTKEKPGNFEINLQRPLSVRERKNLEKKLTGEEEAACHIDFYLRDSPNWAVIHDFRLEWNGRVAQIDHLLISRLMDVYVIESKSFRTTVRRANGGWERLNFNHWEGIPSPVEQNERHIVVLRELINDLCLTPTRLGVLIPPRFHNMVVMPPNCSIIGKFTRDEHVLRMDTLVQKIRSDEPAALDVFRIIASEALGFFASKLLELHKPVVELRTNPPVPSVRAAAQCAECGAEVDQKTVYFCRINSTRFSGRVLCRNCQASLVRVPASVVHA